MRAQHREMVRDGLGVGGPDADVDERRAVRRATPVAADQVVGRHLVAVPGRGRDHRRGVGARGLGAFDHDPARKDEAFEVALAPGQDVEAEAHELVDVAMVVGEQDPRLDVAPVRARVVDETAQRKVDPDRVEECQGPRAFRLVGLPEPVGDLVAHRREQRHREMAGEVGRGGAVAGEVGPGLDHVGVRDLLGARSDLDRDAVVAHQRVQLIQEIGPESSPAASRWSCRHPEPGIWRWRA